jgi:hypothetical protein
MFGGLSMTQAALGDFFVLDLFASGLMTDVVDIEG